MAKWFRHSQGRAQAILALACGLAAARGSRLAVRPRTVGSPGATAARQVAGFALGPLVSSLVLDLSESSYTALLALGGLSLMGTTCMGLSRPPQVRTHVL